MFLTKLKSCVAVLVVAVLCTQAARAQKPVKPGRDDVTGRFKAVDAEKNTITLTVNITKNSPGEEKTFDLSKDAKIVIESKDGKLTDLNSQMTITLAMKDAKAVLVQATDNQPLESFSGALKALNGEKNTITLTLPATKLQPAAEPTFDIDPEAKIVIDQSKRVKLADLPVGSQIQLTLSRKGKGISIIATGPTVIGTLKAIDSGKNAVTLTISGAKGSPPEERTIEVSKEATIAIDKNKVAKLGDLLVDTPIALTLSIDQKNALRISARSTPETTQIKGVVTNLDPTKDSVTLSISKGKGQPPEDQSYTIPKEAKIYVNLDQAGKLADLKTGSTVTLEVTPSQKIVALRAVGSSITGILKAIDAEKNKITLEVLGPDKSTEDKEFTVAKNAKFSIRKVQIEKLLDFPIGAKVTLTMSIDEKAVIVGSAQPQ